MNFTILQNKRLLNGKIDFSDRTFIHTGNEKLLTIWIVERGFEMRWDKISYKFYGNSDYADGLMKFNNHSNPFSVNIGDELIIPLLSGLNNCYARDTSINRIENEQNTTIKLINKSIDTIRAKFLQRKKQKLFPTKDPSERGVINKGNNTFKL